MVKLLRQSVFSALLLLCPAPEAGFAAKPVEVFTIAILPCTDVVMTVKKFTPLVNYLTEKTGLKIELLVPESAALFTRAMKSGDADFVLQDPHLYVATADFFAKDTLIRALNHEGTTTQRGVIVARKDGPVKTVEDLKGRTVMFGHEFSASKWLGAKVLLEEKGILIDRDLAGYSHGGCCVDIAFQVYLGAVDAGVVCDHFLDDRLLTQQELGVKVEELFVVARTAPMPTRVFAAHRTTDTNLASRVSDALLGLDRANAAHEKILRRAELGGFEKVDDADYDGMRRMTGATD